jgi:hypothetical protein
MRFMGASLAARLTLVNQHAIVAARAGLIDDLHPARVPILLSSGERLFDHLDGGPAGYKCVEQLNSPAVTHIRLSQTASHPGAAGDGRTVGGRGADAGGG